MTVCCTFMENPYIQFYGQSTLCKRLAISLQERINNLAIKAGKDWHPHEPKGTVIIVDRAFDINSPIMHDYCYEVMIYDLLNVNKDGALDPDNFKRNWAVEEVKAPLKKEVKKTSKEESKVQKPLIFLGDSDPLWKNYRLLHVLDVINKVMDDAKEIAKTGQKLQEVDQNPDLSQLLEVMAAMPNYKDTIESIGSHQKIAGKISENPDELNRLIEVEQGITSGIEPENEEIDNRKVSGMIGSFLVDFPSLNKEDFSECFYCILLIMMYHQEI